MLMSIPSPSQGVLHLGPIPLRAYAFAIILGVVVAVWLGERRWQARGGRKNAVSDIAIVAVPLGIVGGRLYHVITDWQLYFSHDSWHPWRALAIWQGGLGIWGGIALGIVGLWFGVRRRGLPLAPFLDALAPGVAFAQAIGRWGNYFNQEVYGRPTSLPWGLEIDQAHRVPGFENAATYHPTFLYESLWCIGLGVLLLWADRRFRLGGGRVFWLYVAGYTLGRGWIEALRIDNAHKFFGLRLNDYVSITVFLVAVAMLVRLRGRHSDDPDEVAAIAAGSAELLDGPASDDGGEPDDGDPDGGDPAGADADPAVAVAEPLPATTD